MRHIYGISLEKNLLLNLSDPLYVCYTIFFYKNHKVNIYNHIVSGKHLDHLQVTINDDEK